MRRALSVVTAIGVTAISAIVAWRCHGKGGGEKPRAAGAGEEEAAGEETSGRRLRRDRPKRMVSPVAPTVERPGARAGTIFTTMCADTSPKERCEQGQALADRCATGDAAACVQVADLFFQVPVQPMFGTAYLGMACKLGDPSACERQRQQLVMMKWPEGKREGDRSPSEVCETGDPVGCFHATFWPSMRDEPVDPKLAWKACVAGIADACSTVAEYTDDPATAVQAIEVGCKARSPLHCGLLVSMYDDGLVCCEEPLAPIDERDPCFPCPGFDRSRAEGYSAQVLTLTGKPYDPRYEDVPAEESEDE